MLVEIELQLLISYVNTQLFKGVDTEVLKSENVQNSDVSDITLPTWDTYSNLIDHYTLLTCVYVSV